MCSLTEGCTAPSSLLLTDMIEKILTGNKIIEKVDSVTLMNL
jgi:hypothetical protein